MLNNLTNFFNLIANGLIKKTVAPTDMIALGTKNPKFGGGYRPTGITMADFLTQIPGGTGPQGPQGPAGPQGVAGPVGPAGLNWQGAWVSGTSYVIDDAVGYSGASYFCINATSGTTDPATDTVNWALLAQQGSPGVAGPQGIAGPNAIVVGYTTVTSGIPDRVFFQSGTVTSQDSRFRYITSRGSLISTGKLANVQNTALGDFALSNTTGTGLYNTAVGYQALRNLSSGYDNVAIGNGAAAQVNNGVGNVAIGKGAMGFGSTSASGLVAIGQNALVQSPAGSVAVGAGALSFTTGQLNTALGQQAGINTLAGQANVFVGPQTGYGNYTGSNNIFIGYAAGYIGNFNSTCVIGQGSATANNQMVIGEIGSEFGTVAAQVNTSTKYWEVTIN
jgi:hypothetical protein